MFTSASFLWNLVKYGARSNWFLLHFSRGCFLFWVNYDEKAWNHLFSQLAHPHSVQIRLPADSVDFRVLLWADVPENPSNMTPCRPALLLAIVITASQTWMASQTNVSSDVYLKSCGPNQTIVRRKRFLTFPPRSELLVSLKRFFLFFFEGYAKQLSISLQLWESASSAI